MKENIYQYAVTLIEEFPSELELTKTGTIETKDKWYGHSFADPIGRIYEDGRKESFLIKDRENEETKLFDLALEAGCMRKRHRNVINRKERNEYAFDEYYAMRKVEGHSSTMPTVIHEALDNPINVRYRYTYKILLVVNEEYRRYITQEIETNGPYTYSMIQEMESLEEVFEEWYSEGKNGFWYDEEENSIYVQCYNDFGEMLECSFANIDELKMAINSVRIIKLESEMVK